ncbi:substrate-binding periplasmic protein [Fundidesulfovibrio putealis]|uniref:substrate-binding periplasmic protein n=1 Tax=Fundidesulfovibrio putealis TaxID=270496 RepID=UPI00047F4A99|nr:transporter substrate-binding domain-containing protein [Fundidesulfovibrio putealis]
MHAVFAIALILLTAFPARSEPIEFYYPERPPYSYTQDGKPTGLLIELSRDVLFKAGIEATFTEMPAPRMFAELQRDDVQCCLVGALKVPGREAYGVFTRPIFEDSPLVALVLAKNQKLFAGKHSFVELATNNNLKLGLIASWSYGEHVDGVIKKHNTQVTHIPTPTQQGLMLATERFQYTLTRESEVDEIIRLSGRQKKDFLVMPLSDLNERRERFIFCGKGVPTEVIERINAAIDAVRAGSE